MRGGYTIPKEDTLTCPECGKLTHIVGITLDGRKLTNCQHLIGEKKEDQ